MSVRQLTDADWQAYRDYYKALPDPHHFDQYLKGRDLDAHETYQQFFDATINAGTLVMFGMWSGDQMIGQSSIAFIETDNGKMALLAGSEIAPEFRGQRLVDHFYKARIEYLDRVRFDGEVRVTMRPDNTSSHRAAQRNGFENTGRLDEYGYCIFMKGDQGGENKN